METLKYFLEFTFQSIWHWLGVFFLLGIIGNSIANIFRGIFHPAVIIPKENPPKEKQEDED